MKNQKYLLLKRSSSDNGSRIRQICETKFVSVSEFKTGAQAFVRQGWECAADAHGAPVLFDAAALPDGENVVNRVETKRAFGRFLNANQVVVRRTAQC